MTVLRDTGCTSVLVKRNFVNPDQYTGKYAVLRMVDNSMKAVPTATIHVDTPYYTGDVEAMCMPDVVCDLIIGNVEGAKDPGDLKEINPEACAAVTRAQAARQDKVIPLKVKDSIKTTGVNKAELIRLQKEDKPLLKLQEKKTSENVGRGQARFEVKDGVLFMCILL